MTQLFNESIVSFEDFVQMKYREIKVSRCLMNTRLLLNEFDEVLTIMKQSSYGNKIAGEWLPKVVEANVLCEQLVNTVCGVEATLTKLEDQFEDILRGKVDKTIGRLNELLQDVIDPSLMEVDLEMAVAQKTMKSLSERFEKYSGRLDDFSKFSQFLGFEIVIDTSLASQVELCLKYRRMLWELTNDIEILKSSINKTMINLIPKKEIDEFIAKKQSTVH